MVCQTGPSEMLLTKSGGCGLIALICAIRHAADRICAV